jgi:hypothetical protein
MVYPREKMRAGQKARPCPFVFVNISQDVGQNVGREVRRERMPGEADLQPKQTGAASGAILAA